ncbi:M28 family peptidase [Acidaminobacter sp. JC074]|uniref:M28 family metallopeptidase n=1 Tax=Acidaminobacter sp. JC074 TaxID=2530199 RepID=UPI001F0E73BC|nr:M20/M25/M40 family metallo-hydrolase [Acidaminobacter sp. JC074]MCH4886708.1 M28 family peptidase [Acidaminobacter sp. JC074]
MKRVLLIMMSFLLISCTQTAEVAVTENEPLEESVVEEEVVEPLEEVFDYKVDIDRAIETIDWMAQIEYGGRQAGSKGNMLAEDKLVEAFQDAGLKQVGDSYKQTYEQVVLLPEASTLMKLEGQEPFVYQEDFTERFVRGRTDFEENVEAEMVFIKNVNDLKDDIESFDDKILLLTSELYYDDLLWVELKRLERNDVTIKALVVNNGSDIRVTRAIRGSHLMAFDAEDPILIFCRTDVFSQLMTSDKKLIIEMDFEEKTANPSNVVGMIEGQDSDGDNEVVIVGAHFDHVGNNLDGTFNPGALDNASGVSVILELAHAFRESKPDNTIYFVAFNGEEDGLLGSEYFVDNSKDLFNSQNAVMLNFDMVGSSAEIPLMLGYVYDRDKALCESIAAIADENMMTTDLGVIYGSDHANFSAKGIPSVCFIHFDDAYYHTSGDTLENAVDKDRLEDVIDLAVEVLKIEANK